MRAKPADPSSGNGGAPLARLIGWLFDKTIKIAANRRYGTLVVKFVAGKPVHVSFEEKLKIEELPPPSETGLLKTLTNEQIHRLAEAGDS